VLSTTGIHDVRGPLLRGWVEKTRGVDLGPDGSLTVESSSR